MIVFNNFNNNKRTNVTETDILIGATSLCQYKIFGYTTKLYCLKEDIDFLKKWHLYELYDIIDTEFLENNEQLKKVDETIFWSTRKIEEMYHELFELEEDCIYSDTDIIMNMPFNLTEEYDALLGSNEPENRFINANDINGKIYLDGKLLSTPIGYEMPEYIKKTDDAYNCGIGHFKNKDFFLEYRNEYYKFVIDNPGVIIADDGFYKNENAFPCSAEQRILKAVLNKYNFKINFIMPEKKMGVCELGAHFYAYKTIGRYLKVRNTFKSEKRQKVFDESLLVLNATIADCLLNLRYYSSQLYFFYSSLLGLKNFEKEFYENHNKTYIKEYY